MWCSLVVCKGMGRARSFHIGYSLGFLSGRLWAAALAILCFYFLVHRTRLALNTVSPIEALQVLSSVFLQLIKTTHVEYLT